MHFLIWIIIAVLLSVIEIFTAGFVFIFFALGAMCAGLVSVFSDSLIIQLLVFMISSTVAVLYARPILKRTMNVSEQPDRKSNVAKVVGEDILVLEDVDRYKGKVRLLHSGEIWSAYLKTENPDEVVPAGQEGVVTEVDGAKLVIRAK